MKAFTKVLHPADMKMGERHEKLFCKVEFDGSKLSICAVVGPRPTGNARGGCGQIIMEFSEYDHRGYTSLSTLRLAKGWTRATVRKLFDVWNRWHLNDMKAGSATQEEYLRAHPVVAVYPESHYDKASKALADAGLNPDADGYSYGHAWKHEDVPADVLEFLTGLPDTDVTPAWC
jgi:hypothetical protein